jgi:hypothetical protein
MVVGELPKIGGSANFAFVVVTTQKSAAILFYRKPKMHNLIFDLVDQPITRIMWGVIASANDHLLTEIEYS